MRKQYHYEGNPVAVVVQIYSVDVSADLRGLGDIQKSVDFPNLTEFRVGECSFTLRDLHGDYAPNNASNFFTRHMGHRTGYQAPVHIEAGFIVQGTRRLQTVFKGQIVRLVQNAKAGTVKVVCTDTFGDIRKKPITDFGIARHFKLSEDDPETPVTGVYPIMKAALPASDESVSLKTRSTDTPIKPVQKLATEGHLDPRNYIVTAEGLRAEGFMVNRGVGYPQIQMKSPFRYRKITDVIADILTHAGITQSEITLPDIDTPAHFSSNGRPNYDLIGTIGADQPLTWNGYVTDCLHDATEDKFYFLYNGGRNNANGVSQVLVYAVATRTWTSLHTFTAGTEVWKFMKTGNTFFIVATTGGAYDAKDTSCETQIIKLDIAGTPPTGTETVFVNHTATLVPQLAHYYFGVGIYDLPDTRRSLIYRENDGLYYVYVDRSADTFGIAKATQGTQASVIQINQDAYGNHAGIDFDITASGVLKGATTFLSGARSQTLVFTKGL